MVGTVKMLVMRHCSTSAQTAAGVEAVAGWKHGLGGAGDLDELVDSGAVRQGRHDKGGVPVPRAGHEVAEVVGDDKGHLAVGEHGGLGPAGGAGGEEEPAGVVVLDVGDRRGLAVVPGDQGVVVVRK